MEHGFTSPISADVAEPGGVTHTERPNGHTEVACLVEKLGRLYLDLVRLQLRRLGLEDLSATQMIMLLSVGPGEISVNDILARGGYVGSTMSHSLKQLVQRDYLVRNSSSRDRRLARIRLSAKGQRVCALFRADDAKRFRGPEDHASNDLYDKLRGLQDSWSHALRFSAVLTSLCWPSLFTDAALVSSYI